MPDSKWLEVSLVVDNEYAEVVAEVLARFAPNGVVIESTQIKPDPEGEGEPVGPLRVCAYLAVDERLQEIRQKLDEALWYLGRIWEGHPLPAPHYTFLGDIDWYEAWKQHYRPIEIGRNLIIVPAWMEVDEKGRIPIRMDPGMAFGTGTHPTTQLCLDLLQDYITDTVIDVGCGSGILSIAALKLGADKALGVDVDAQAIPVARENAIANGVADRLELGLGSVEEINKGEFTLRKAPLVLANILAPILVRLFDNGLAEIVSPGGALILSGILDEQWQGADEQGGTITPLKEAVRMHDLHVIDLRQQGDWIAVAVSR